MTQYSSLYQEENNARVLPPVLGIYNKVVRHYQYDVTISDH